MFLRNIFQTATFNISMENHIYIPKFYENGKLMVNNPNVR